MNKTNKSPYIIAADSRRGGRTENQDSFAYSQTPAGMLAVVCDGMGGGPGGRFASSLAVNTIFEYVCSQDSDDDAAEILVQAIKAAHGALLRAATENPSLHGMGTTVTALLLNEYSAVAAHVGDSRIYQLRGGRKKFRTFDHSMVFELVKNKSLTEEQARLSAESNIITQALGVRAEIDVAVQELSYEKGDRFMLCTDGIWGMFPEKEIVSMATRTQSVSGTVDSMVIAVDQAGTESGGRHDNLTMIMAEMTTDSIFKEKMDRKTRFILYAMAALLLLSLAGHIAMYSKNRALTKHLNEYNATIDSLKTDNLSLKERIEMMVKDADKRADEESKAEARKADEEREKADAAMRAEIQNAIKKIDDIIAQLKALSGANASKDKQKKADNLKKEVDKLRNYVGSKYDINAADWESAGKDISTLMGNSIMGKDDTKDNKNKVVAGHYNTIVKILERVKAKINNCEKQ